MLTVATDRDCARLAELHASAVSDAWTGSAFAALMVTPGVSILLAAHGFVAMRTVADEAEILMLAVAPEERRAGLGRALMVATASAARAAGAARLYLEVSVKNQAARALYAGLGFVEVGRRRAYYADGADGLVLSLALS